MKFDLVTCKCPAFSQQKDSEKFGLL